MRESSMILCSGWFKNDYSYNFQEEAWNNSPHKKASRRPKTCGSAYPIISVDTRKKEELAWAQGRKPCGSILNTPAYPLMYGAMDGMYRMAVSAMMARMRVIVVTPDSLDEVNVT